MTFEKVLCCNRPVSAHIVRGNGLPFGHVLFCEVCLDVKDAFFDTSVKVTHDSFVYKNPLTGKETSTPSEHVPTAFKKSLAVGHTLQEEKMSDAIIGLCIKVLGEA